MITITTFSGSKSGGVEPAASLGDPPKRLFIGLDDGTPGRALGRHVRERRAFVHRQAEEPLAAEQGRLDVAGLANVEVHGFFQGHDAAGVHIQHLAGFELALYHGAKSVDAVELNPQMTELVQDTYSDFAGFVYDDPRVTVYTMEARGFVARTESRYDLIHIGLLDSFAASGAGVQAQSESYIYTVEAIAEYLKHTSAGGMLAITRWLKHPPRDGLKLIATAIEALESLGVGQPGMRLAVIRSWNTSTLLVKNGALTADEIALIRRFSKSRSFDTAWFPGIEPRDTNRFNQLE